MKSVHLCKARSLRLKPGPMVALVTILAIVATLVGCGRYGKPKRPTPAPAEQLQELRMTAPAVPSSFLAGS